MRKNADLTPLAGERQADETDNAVIACNDFLRLGPGRSLPLVLEKYTAQSQGKPPTKSLSTLKIWSMRFEWTARAREYDIAWEAAKDAERDAVLRAGLALDYERVRKLTRLAEYLEGEIYATNEDGQHHNVWLHDVKQIGSGETAERVDIVRFNTGLIDQYRATLDDLAKETGGRIHKTDITTGGEAMTGLIVNLGDDDE